MKCFEQNSKVNFIDEKNVCVGYDMDQCCCENADWFVAAMPTASIGHADTDVTEWPGFIFDTEYDSPELACDELDEGGMVVFRLTNGADELFLHLYNCQNGYYSHGFEFKDGEKTLKSGAL